MKSLGGQVPDIEFQKLAIKIFDELLEKLDENLIQLFNNIQINDKKIDIKKLGIKAPSATWTYTINDQAFENLLGLQLIGNIGMSAISVFLFGPLLALYPILKKLKKR